MSESTDNGFFRLVVMVVMMENNQVNEMLMAELTKASFPYTERESEQIGLILHKLNIPSISPVTGIQLVRIVNAMDEKIKEMGSQPNFTEPMREVMINYRARLLDIAGVAAFHQRATIEQLERLSKG